MRIKYADIESYYSSLKNAGNLKLPRVIRAAIARNMLLLDLEYRIYQPQKDEIIRTYAKKDEKGNTITGKDENGMLSCTIEPERINDFKNDMKDLESIEIELNIQTFPRSAFDLCDESDRYDIPTATQEAALSWMTEEEEDG